MVSQETKLVIQRANQTYRDQLEGELEATRQGRFVAIEPESGDYFVADTFDAAVRLAREKHPARLSHTLRIGHPAAFHLGEMFV